MKNNASLLYSLFMIMSDSLTLLAAFVAAFVLRVSLSATPIITPVPARTYFAITLSLVPIWIIIFSLLGLYNRSVYDKRFSEISRLAIGTVLGVLSIIAVEYFTNDPIFPAKMVPIYAAGLTFILLILSRNIVRLIRQILFRYNFGVSNVLIVGNTDMSVELIDWLGKPQISGYRILATVSGHKHGSIRHFTSFSEATKALRSKKIDSIMQTELFADAAKNSEVLTFAQTNHVAYRFIPGNTELFIGNIDVELFQSSIPMIAVHQTALIGWGRIVKRLFDLLVASLLCILLSPLLLIIALLNFMFTGGVFFRQTRLTRFNQKFRVFKFQTLKKAYNGMSPEEGFAKMNQPLLLTQFRKNGDFLSNDPRLTGFGRFMRRTSLDELPQLFNVIKGDISLVGPRALVPNELEAYTNKHKILSVKSGMTGLAQVSGRKNISFDERRKLDVFYVQNWSFWFDIVIMLKTLRVVINQNDQ